MYCTVDNNEYIRVHADDSDICFKCKNIYKCPLIHALSKEYVVLRYSDIEVRECALFKR